ncbi:MAG TPA: pyridoxal phosphate-dependent aminotransferase [Nitrospiria bacterium]|nr:pyridoxal phosphate-dependent aminotransferase [Nitrospiria bacterium]
MSIRLSRLASTFHAETNPLYRERDQRLAQGLPVVDLVSGNVTEQGIAFPPDLLRSILADAAGSAQTYRPVPFGQLPAREAVSAYYRAQGVDVPVAQIVLTPGTSLAYWYAFSLFCDPGDEVLTPRPSYPLFDDIATLANVRVTSYRLDETRGWAIDLTALDAAITDRTRAIVLISPHNPTGAVATREEIHGLAAVARERGLPIIADEVFGEFLFGLDALPRPAATDAPLVVTLNGMSKMFALPGMKLGWMTLTGAAADVARSLGALERMSDAFLPVNETAQAAAPRIMSEGRHFLARYRAVIESRGRDALAVIRESPRVSLVSPRGGFYASLRVDTAWDDETLALHILRASGVLVHPGFFYDLDPTHIVLSLVSAPEGGLDAIRRVLDAIATAPPGD